MMDNNIRYWIGEADEYPLYYRTGGEECGLYADFIKKLGDITGKNCVRVTEEDGNILFASDALDMLEQGGLDLVIGLPEGLDTKAESVPVYENTLTAFILRDSPQAGKLVENCYWGIDSALLFLTENTPLDGHVLDFNNDEELFSALENGDIYGILVKRSVLDYTARFGKEHGLHEFEGLKLPCRDSVYYNAENKELAAKVTAAANALTTGSCNISGYSGMTHQELIIPDTLAENYNLLADSRHDLSLFSSIAYIGIGCSAVFGILAAVFASKYLKSRKAEAAKLATLFDGESDRELFELNLITGKMYAYKDFELFGVTKGSLPNPIKLEKLSHILGYDFKEHFSHIQLAGSTIYRNRFIIHAGGRKLYISESGRRIGTTLMLTMVLVKAE